MEISDAEFEQMLNQARESLIRGLLPAARGAADSQSSDG
jgi:hypothetical protein